MADSGSFLDSQAAAIDYLIPAALGSLSDSQYGVGYNLFGTGLYTINGVIDSQFGDSISNYGEIAGGRLIDSIHDSSYEYKFVPATMFGQGLILSLDSDAQNATGDGGGSGGLTQYWIG